MPSTAAVNTMIESFKTRNVKRRDPSSRIICGIRHADFDALFPNQDTQNPGWLGLWRPRDDATAVYQPLIWGNLPKIQIIAGQHRKLALKIHDPTNFNWVCNVYDLDAIPAPTLIELGGNPTTVAHAATMGEIFRDMAAVAPHLAAQDTLIVQPHLNPRRPPTLNEYLGASRSVTLFDNSCLILRYADSETIQTRRRVQTPENVHERADGLLPAEVD